MQDAEKTQERTSEEKVDDGPQVLSADDLERVSEPQLPEGAVFQTAAGHYLDRSAYLRWLEVEIERAEAKGRDPENVDMWGANERRDMLRKELASVQRTKQPAFKTWRDLAHEEMPLEG